MPGRDPARGARDTGRTGGSIGGRDTKGGAKDRDGGVRAPAGTGNAGYASGGSVGGFSGNETKSLGRQISDLFGGPQAFATNPSWAGNQTKTGMVASFPDAPLAYGLAALASAPMGAMGFAGRIADIAMGGTGHGMLADAMAAQGMGPGKQGPDVPGGGKERGGQGGALRDNENPLYNNTPMEAQQVIPPAETPVNEFRKRQYALGLNGVPAPLGYQYGTARWL